MQIIVFYRSFVLYELFVVQGSDEWLMDEQKERDRGRIDTGCCWE